MMPCPPGGRKQPPPVKVQKHIPEGPSGGDWGQKTPIYPDVAWTKKSIPPIPERKPHTPPTTIIVATDGSVGRAPHVGYAAGWAWVTEHGKADAGVIKAGDIRVAELAAIAAACTAPELNRHKLHILTDSQDAIWIVQNIINGHPPDGVSKSHTTAIKTRANTAGLTIEWVKGHNGHQLNEIADRLALMARRRYQAKVEGDIHQLARAIAQRELQEAS